MVFSTIDELKEKLTKSSNKKIKTSNLDIDLSGDAVESLLLLFLNQQSASYSNLSLGDEPFQSLLDVFANDILSVLNDPNSTKSLSELVGELWVHQQIFQAICLMKQNADCIPEGIKNE